MAMFGKSRRGQSESTTESMRLWKEKNFKQTSDVFFAPEWFPQSGVQLIWPTDDTDWKYMLSEVTDCYVRIAFEISQKETLLVVTSQKQYVEKLLHERLPSRCIRNICLYECPINDTWARDSGVLSKITRKGVDILDFGFNGWGNKFKADKDNTINSKLKDAGILHGNYVNKKDFILEGGSIETDGKGRLLTTESCLLSPQRNAGLDKAGIERMLREVFNLREVLWLKHGKLEGDDTDGHIDTLARMCQNDIIAYVKCSNPQDSHYEEMALMEEELKGFSHREDEPFKLEPLPMPDAIYDKENGERLPATYANYLVINDAVLVPTYNQPSNDNVALETIGNIYKDREIIAVPSTALIRQHGSIHCSAMQFPVGVYETNKTKTI